MSSLPVRRASSPEEDSQLKLADTRKRKRMLSNRESAKRSRMKKQQHLDDLINLGAQLKTQNIQTEMKVNIITQQYHNLEKENNVMRAQVMELTDRLKSLNSILRCLQEVSGVPMDIPEIPDPLLRPWQLPCPAQPIMAAADMFQF
ncbi:bZIP transcription factor 53-like [Typha latifolia]|uniref:bZIP transcription factor 53-like n=1 Tax=Typha latifolia TaxID=4733 RepID=UPI003C2C50C1